MEWDRKFDSGADDKVVGLVEVSDAQFIFFATTETEKRNETWVVKFSAP